MKRFAYCIEVIVSAAFFVFLSSCSQSVGSAGFTAGYAAISRFDSLTEAQCGNVRNLKIFFQHASVGNNLYNGMIELAAVDARFSFPNTQNSVENLATWFASNSGWGDYYLGNPTWAEKISSFTSCFTAGGIGSVVNVAMMKFCYIDPDASFADYRDAMLELERAYPGVTFIWWTMPITTEGSASRDSFNSVARAYATSNGKYLFDLADIESHNASGLALSDSVGATLCADYTDDGGHLNAVGRARAAKAMWVLLSGIANR